jgi:hypothetical protein
MAFQLTPWGYEVDGPLPPLASDADAASAAIRNACGWHVAPSMTCRCTIDVDGLTRSVWLPARNVTAITSVTVGGAEVTDYQWSRLGQVLFPHPLQSGLQAVVIEYVAGTDDAGDLAALAAGVAARAKALSARPGVTSETAGGVTVSVSASIAAASAAPFLTDTERAALAPYKVVRAHAT